jgi:hypothetical protein
MKNVNLPSRFLRFHLLCCGILTRGVKGGSVGIGSESPLAARGKFGPEMEMSAQHRQIKMSMPEKMIVST